MGCPEERPFKIRAMGRGRDLEPREAGRAEARRGRATKGAAGALGLKTKRRQLLEISSSSSLP
jgi:hypothetical protein